MVTTSFINRLSQAVDRIESQMQPRSFKVVEMYCPPGEDMEVSKARHYKTHPEDRDADVIIRRFFKTPADEGGE